MSINELFAAATNTATPNGGTLAGTTQLTELASATANSIMKIVNENMDTHSDTLVKSQSDSAALDQLVDLVEIDKDQSSLDFLRTIDETTIDNMLKSQQSKRSRCKSKDMTMNNYMSMLTAAIAEKMIRLVSGKEKGNYGGRSGGSVEYSDERLQQLSEDQEALRKEIRNIQSKKSIMKSKAGFEESDERWKALLVAEAQLKGMRASTVTTKVIVDETRDSLKELLAEVNPQDLKAAELKQLLENIKDLAFEDATSEDAQQ